jgi:hypothetical protein
MTLIKPQKDPAIGHGKCDHRKVERVAGRHFGTSVMSDNKFKTAADTMEVMMAMLDWNDYRNQILARVGQIGKLSLDTVKGYMAIGVPGPRLDTLTARSAR